MDYFHLTTSLTPLKAGEPHLSVLHPKHSRNCAGKTSPEALTSPVPKSFRATARKAVEALGGALLRRVAKP
jgi:hypothetical protein